MDQRITITIPVQGVQEIVRALGVRPYNDVAGLIEMIIKQTTDQLPKEAPAAPVERELS